MTPPPAAARVVVGIDIGGTKTHVLADGSRGAAARREGSLTTPGAAGTSAEGAAPNSPAEVDVVVPSEGWSATPVEGAAQWITEVLARAGVGKVDALAVGAQGCEEPAHAEELRDALRERLGGVPVLVVNDAELLLPAAGLERGIALIGGTGAIAVRSDGAGTTWRAGGWGWVLSDDGSASALVRDAARAVLAAADLGGPPGLLARRLLEAVGVPGIPELALALSWGEAPEHWGRYAPAVVGAAEEGDETARTVLAAGARALARLVDVLTARTGGTPEPVVAAGGLLTGVPSYWAAVESHLRTAHPARDIRLLTSPPATGALALAYGLL